MPLEFAETRDARAEAVDNVDFPTSAKNVERDSDGAAAVRHRHAVAGRHALYEFAIL